MKPRKNRKKTRTIKIYQPSKETMGSNSRTAIQKRHSNKWETVIILDAEYYVKTTKMLRYDYVEIYKTINYDPTTANNETFLKKKNTSEGLQT